MLRPAQRASHAAPAAPHSPTTCPGCPGSAVTCGFYPRRAGTPPAKAVPAVPAPPPQHSPHQARSPYVPASRPRWMGAGTYGRWLRGVAIAVATSASCSRCSTLSGDLSHGRDCGGVRWSRDLKSGRSRLETAPDRLPRLSAPAMWFARRSASPSQHGQRGGLQPLSPLSPLSPLGSNLRFCTETSGTARITCPRCPRQGQRAGRFATVWSVSTTLFSPGTSQAPRMRDQGPDTPSRAPCAGKLRERARVRRRR